MKEILIYGEIGTEVKARNIIEEIKDESDIILRINSYGGEVFEAQAIYNQLRGKTVDVKIDGVCASSATLIACVGRHISMPRNGIYMIHLPATSLFGYYTSKQLESVISQLTKVTETILEVYSKRTNLETSQMLKKLEEETWLTSEEALDLGLIDEIVDADPDIENKVTRINMLANEEKVKKFMDSKQIVDERSLYEKFKDLFNREYVGEKARLEALDKVETQSISQKAIIELAKRDGRTLEQIQPELDAIGIAEKSRKETEEGETKRKVEAFLNQIVDYLESGGKEVGSGKKPIGSSGLDEVVRYAKEMKK